MIPSGYYTNTKGMDPEDIRVVQFGIPRSGSTFVWQCLCDLLPEGGVVKTHDWLDVDMPVVVTLRDFRDVIVSRWRLLGGCGVMTKEEIYQECGLVRQPAWVLDNYLDSNRSTLVIRYEQVHAGLFRDDWNLLVLSIRQMEEALSLVGKSEAEVHEIAERHSMERNRRRAPKSGEYDRATLLHPGHVHEGEVGGWKKFVRVEDWQLVNDLLGDLLEKWGYT